MKKDKVGNWKIVKLCHNESELLLSHIYPKFIGKWMKATGGDRFRYGGNMDKPEQDFPKQKLLCKHCENLFCKWEKQFSERMFKPFMNKNIHYFEYEDWFFKFLISVLWRVLIVRLSKPITNNNQKFEQELIEAEKDWRLFLNDEIETPQFANIQVLLVSGVVDDNLSDIEGLNYYLLRAVDSDICSNEKMCLVFLKLARFIIVCPIVGNIRVGINVIDGSGILKETTSRIDKVFGSYLFDKIAKYDDLVIGYKQQDKIEERFKKNIENIRGSNLEYTMRLDFERQNGK